MKLHYVFGMFLLIGTSGCKKWLAIDKNPNILVESNASPDQVLPSALANNFLFTTTYFTYLNYWMGYWCPPDGVTITDETQTYNISPNFQFETFRNLFQNNANYEFIEGKAAETNQTFYQAIAKVMKGYNYATLVDIYNNIPYREALYGYKGEVNNLYPHYDDAKFIYDDIMKQLDDAVELIKGANVDKNVKISVADIMFHANKFKWIKFINTLKLRLLIHQANRADRALYIQSEIAKIKSEGSGFLASGESASINPGFTSELFKDNPYYSGYGFFFDSPDPYFRANIIAMNFLKADNDPRLEYFYKISQQEVPIGGAEPFSQPPPSNFRGNQFGFENNPSIYPYQNALYTSAVGGISLPGPVTASSSGIIKGYNMDGWILTNVESLFLQAEAIQRGWIDGDAKVSYLNALKESFLWLNVNGSSTAAISAFDTWYTSQAGNSGVDWDAAIEKYKLLCYQKYLALNGIQPTEVWTDYRRNGSYPVIPLSAHSARTSNSIPIRLLYPQQEYDVNTANVLAQGKIDQFTSKIWWMP